MAIVHYLTHPQVQIDPDVPVPKWGLSPIGEARAVAAARLPWAAGIGRIVSSDEVKAIETARIFGARLGIRPQIREGMHENDRSATGYLPPPQFEAMADRFFAEPEVSAEGWERAVDAQARIVAAVEAVLAEEVEDGADRDLLLVGHGGVGTLLLCRLAGLPISRSRDQGPGGGNRFAFDRDTRAVLQGWTPFDA
ncbi:histidine phosphatase family protein [Prosthecomicrobium sp. N25]|uniref:histidine phosphatase family protein n=1 Tax=Prosthecomicrobium sp. N25 TaxID=3129254 RepID=UPI003077FED4